MLRRMGDRDWGLKPHTALPQVQGGGGTETSGGRGGDAQKGGGLHSIPRDARRGLQP